MFAHSISILTCLAMLWHSLVGCCWHHAHSDCDAHAATSEVHVCNHSSDHLSHDHEGHDHFSEHHEEAFPDRRPTVSLQCSSNASPVLAHRGYEIVKLPKIASRLSIAENLTVNTENSIPNSGMHGLTRAVWKESGIRIPIKR